ncbi:hypothetical protein GGI12_001312 [Dipsacomyces acuminosporus]|nr:hypothetical protein GGI12_001312 [Dipsacomyces acuminosporus]
MVFGTGDMVKKLVAGELDIAICVTEGLVAGIRNNADSASLKLFGTYVNSPLPWAASVAVDSKFVTMDDLAFGATFGISRKGSGSEVMARYAASAYEWAGQPKFEVLGDVHGLVAGVQQGKVDAFLWERTTMQRHYASSEVRYLGTVRPPWPAFSFGATHEFIARNGDTIKALIDTIGRAQAQFMAAESAELRTGFVCDKFGYSKADAEQWADYVQFNESGSVDESKIRAVTNALKRAGVITGDCSVSDIVLLPS